MCVHEENSSFFNRRVYREKKLIDTPKTMAKENGHATAPHAASSSHGHYNVPPPNLQNDFVHHSNPRSECNDVFFLLIFLGSLIMTIVFAGKYGSQFLDATSIDDLTETSGYQAVLKVILYCSLSAIGIAFGWILIMIVAGQFLIWASFLFIILGFILSGILLSQKLYDADVQQYWWPGVLFGTCALLVALYVCCIHKRIKFAAAHLKVAGAAILTLPMSVIVALVMVFVQMGWIFTWILGEFGILYHGNYIQVPPNCTLASCKISTEGIGPVFGITFAMVIVFFWVAKVARNIVHVTVAGTVGAWKVRSSSPMITIKAWIRAMTLSLGSICCGSLLVAILETIKQTLNAAKCIADRSGNCIVSCIAGCFACIIGCIEKLVEIFNRYAFTYVGVYGYSFFTAGSHVSKLFQSKGWSAIVNDDLTGIVFWLGDVVVASLSAVIGVALVGHDKQEFQNISQPQLVVGSLAFLSGYAISHIFMAVMASGVCTVFVLWAEDPHGWRLTHPEHHERLHSAWMAIYPHEYNEGFGHHHQPPQHHPQHHQQQHII